MTTIRLHAPRLAPTGVLVLLPLLLAPAQGWAQVDFELVNEGRVIARDGKDTGFPSVIRVPDWVPTSARPASNANYYMYYGNHEGRFIRMKWAETLDGSWTAFDLGGIYNGRSRRGVFDVDADWTRQSFDHVAHPEVVVDHESQRFILSYHGENQPSETSSTGTKVRRRHKQFVATSKYGLNFNDPTYAGGEPGHGPVTVTIDDLTRDMWIGSSYQRIFRYRGGWYSVGRRGILNKAPDPANPLAPNASDPQEMAWLLESTPTALWTDDASTVQDDYRSPGCTFLASSEFANHPNNPSPGTRITCKGGSSSARLNHVGANLMADAGLLEVFFYVRNDPDDRYKDLYRLVYDLSEADFQDWHVARDGAGQVLFDVYLEAERIDRAIPGSGSSHAQSYADPESLGTSDYFIDDDGTPYVFYSYVSKALGGKEGEGQISAVRVSPPCSNGPGIGSVSLRPCLP